MRKSNAIILLVAIAMGGTAALMARNWIQANATVTPTAGKIVVASAQLAFGTPLSNDNVTEIPWAAGQIPAGAFASRQALFKDGRRVALWQMERGELILKQKITGPDQRASLSALVENGMRAVTVRVDDVRGVAGFVLPGDRVDVVLIRKIGKPGIGAQERSSDVLLQNVKVLAVDQLANERQEKPTIAKAVTLEVATDQAQKVLLATDVGKLSLILRQAGEKTATPSRTVRERDLGKPDLRDEHGKPITVRVEVVRAMKVDEYNVTPWK
jgi:pilus assembly protein CpaB